MASAPSLRIGVLTDLHAQPHPSSDRAWINAYEPQMVEQRIRAAVAIFNDSGVDTVVLLGDITESADSKVFVDTVAQMEALKVGINAVCGNHDWKQDDPQSFHQACQASMVRALHSDPASFDGVTIAGVGIECAASPPSVFRAQPLMAMEPGALRVVASHFPVVSESRRLAACGLPYPGDLLNRTELRRSIEQDSTPVVVLHGHVHARMARRCRAMLQLGFGALIEPPFDCAVVQLDLGTPPSVKRQCHRLGPLARVEPVFSPEVESWSLVDGVWSIRGRSL